MLLRIFGLHEIPADVLRELEGGFEGFIHAVKGNIDPDTPRESLLAAVAPIGQLMEGRFGVEMNRLMARANRLADRLDSSPRLRGLLANKVERVWRDLAGRATRDASACLPYLQSITRMWPGASIAAMGISQTISTEGYERWVQANALVREAEGRVGEGRYASIKKLARLVLDEMYPPYVRALNFLETVRTGTLVQVKGRQGKAFGSMVRVTAESLPEDAKCLLDPQAHTIRNGFGHDGGARYDHASGLVTLVTESTTLTLSVDELLERLKVMLERYVELMVALLIDGGSFGVDVALKSITWAGIKAKEDQVGPALKAAIAPSIERAAVWLEAQKPKPKPKALPAGPEVQRSGA